MTLGKKNGFLNILVGDEGVCLQVLDACTIHRGARSCI